VSGTSRISREAYVRFCEGLGVKFPRPTRLAIIGARQIALLWLSVPLVGLALDRRGSYCR
jgi:hypothetical protein